MDKFLIMLAAIFTVVAVLFTVSSQLSPSISVSVPGEISKVNIQLLREKPGYFNMKDVKDTMITIKNWEDIGFAEKGQIAVVEYCVDIKGFEQNISLFMAPDEDCYWIGFFHNISEVTGLLNKIDVVTEDVTFIRDELQNYKISDFELGGG